MKARRFEWHGAKETADEVRLWASAGQLDPRLDETLDEIEQAVRGENRDRAVLELTARFDATEAAPSSLRVQPRDAAAALSRIDPALREAMEVAASNIRTVAGAQASAEPATVKLPQGQSVTVREVPVAAAGIYAPGGLAAYPSSVLMCAIPAQVAGVGRIALATPPDPSGKVNDAVLAAAALCDIDEVYAMGGAQAIFALAYGTETIDFVSVIAGPGNDWVQEAKRRVYGIVGIDSYAGPSELMLVAGHDTDPEWAALDLYAQAEHGAGGALLAVAVEEAVLERIAAATQCLAAAPGGRGDPELALVQVPDLTDAIDFANAFAPEHLELLEEDAALLAGRVTTAGCVFAGRHGATAFGDYVAGSNHVLPTGGTGRFAGPLSPGTFRRKISTVEVTAEAAAKLAPHVDTLARAEGFPVHAESAMIRTES
jgi:histidinol dehydrogenase